jgi:hypothetical protein
MRGIRVCTHLGQHSLRRGERELLGLSVFLLGSVSVLGNSLPVFNGSKKPNGKAAVRFPCSDGIKVRQTALPDTSRRTLESAEDREAEAGAPETWRRRLEGEAALARGRPHLSLLR